MYTSDELYQMNQDELVRLTLDMHQELLQRREEVSELMREREMLLKQIESEVENQKPVLPQQVADALEKAKEWAEGDVELVAWSIPLETLKNKEEKEYWDILFEYCDEGDGNFFDIINALRYGYEVEIPHAEKRSKMYERLETIGYEGESAQMIVDVIAPIIFETECEKSR